MARFRSATAKVTRAHQHVQALAEAIDAFLASDPYEITGEADSDGWQSQRIHLVAPVPLFLSTLAGDALHNARSALDHAIYEVSTASAKDREKVAFPLNRKRVKYDNAKASKEWETVLNGVASKYRTIVEGAQPFHRGNELLAALVDFDNVDKHRVLQGGFMRQTIPPRIAVVLGTMPDLEFRSWPLNKRLRDGAEIAAFRGRATTQTVAVNLGLSATVAFGRRNLTVSSLQAIVNAVGYILLDFHRTRYGARVRTSTQQMGGATAVVLTP